MRSLCLWLPVDDCFALVPIRLFRPFLSHVVLARAMEAGKEGAWDTSEAIVKWSATGLHRMGAGIEEPLSREARQHAA